MAEADRLRWDSKYQALAGTPGALADAGPDPWLREHAVGLTPGRAADLACGLGANARWLARQGWEVEALDISPRGLELAASLGSPAPGVVSWRVADLEDCHLPTRHFDLVCVFRFLDRRRFPRWIPELLRPGGRLIYQTFMTAPPGEPPAAALPVPGGPRNPAHLLTPGELRTLFPLEVVAYREAPGGGGWTASLVAQRPALEADLVPEGRPSPVSPTGDRQTPLPAGEKPGWR